MKIKYRPIRDSEEEIVSQLIESLYNEDPGIKLMTEDKIRNTFDKLRLTPELGTILVIETDNNIAGYSILINFWSNEFGGNILFIDELYIKKEFRGQGIGTNFIKHLKDTKYNNAVALQLHVTPNNPGARKLYESLGFHRHKNDTLTFDI